MLQQRMPRVSKTKYHSKNQQPIENFYVKFGVISVRNMDNCYLLIPYSSQMYIVLELIQPFLYANRMLGVHFDFHY